MEQFRKSSDGRKLSVTTDLSVEEIKVEFNEAKRELDEIIKDIAGRQGVITRMQTDIGMLQVKKLKCEATFNLWQGANEATKTEGLVEISLK